MSSKHPDSKFPSSLARPVLDLCHCTSSAESSSHHMAQVVDAHLGLPHEDFLTPSQQEALLWLRHSLQDKGALRKRDSDADLLRFLRARSFDVPKARAMYEAMLDWRKEIGADTIKETFRFPERKAAKEMYPHFHHKTDKIGRPVYVERYGQLHLEDLLKITTLDRLLLYHIKEWEILIDWKFPACSKAAGRPISQSLTILDLKGVTMKHLSKQVRSFMQKITRIDQDYYPEYLGRMLIVNAPTSFKAMWQLVKPWLDKQTQKKIEVHGSNFTGKLLELVDTENLPEFLGGSCRCPGGCENSDAGPWNESHFQPYPEAP